MPTDSNMQGGIYQIRHIPSGKVYIGSAVNIIERWKDHRRQLLRGNHRNRHLQNAWRKYDADQFVFEILEVVTNPEFLVHTEQDYINYFRSCNRDTGYNISPTAGSCLGIKRSPEDRAHLSLINKGKRHSSDVRAKLSMISKGRIFSPETRSKLSVAQKGRKLSPVVCAKISNAAKGRTVSPETRAKLSAAGKGKVIPLDVRAKISATKKGVVFSPEHRANISAANRNPSSETRAKIRAASRARWTPEYQEKLMLAKKVKQQQLTLLADRETQLCSEIGKPAWPKDEAGVSGRASQ